MTSWTGSRIQALSLHRKVGSDGWLPTRGLMSRENFPFFMLYAWALQKVSFAACTLSCRHVGMIQQKYLLKEGRSMNRVILVFLPVIPHRDVATYAVLGIGSVMPRKTQVVPMPSMTSP